MWVTCASSISIMHDQGSWIHTISPIIRSTLKCGSNLLGCLTTAKWHENEPSHTPVWQNSITDKKYDKLKRGNLKQGSWDLAIMSCCIIFIVIVTLGNDYCHRRFSYQCPQMKQRDGKDSGTISAGQRLRSCALQSVIEKNYLHSSNVGCLPCLCYLTLAWLQTKSLLPHSCTSKPLLQ